MGGMAWTPDDDALLMAAYSSGGRQAVLRALPGRTVAAIDTRIQVVLTKTKRSQKYRIERPEPAPKRAWFPMPWVCPIRCRDALAAQRNGS